MMKRIALALSIAAWLLTPTCHAQDSLEPFDEILRRGGVFISVGMPAASEGGLGLSPLDLVRKDALVMSSAVGTVEDMRELVALAADGRVRTHVGRTGTLDDLPTVLDELEAGAYAGRAVLTI